MGRKKTAGDFRQVGFRMPAEHYDLIEAIAILKGVDVTAVLNLLVANSIDDLHHMILDHRSGIERIKAELKGE